MYELYNPNHHNVEVTLAGRGGLIVVAKESCVPTEEHEKAGLTVETFRDYVPSFLRPTPPAVRRRLLEEEGKPVPAPLVSATAHLPEFQRATGSESPPSPPPVAEIPSPHSVVEDHSTSAVSEPTPPVAPPPIALEAQRKPGQLPGSGKRERATRGGSLGESAQEMTDALCSSTRAKRAGRNIDNP